jgi:dephospho-CoA kinase
MRAIALTGRIGSGKSSVARHLHERGAATIDADAIVHALYRGDASLRDALRDRFGDNVFLPPCAQGDIDRAALARIAFADPLARADLEALVHPRVRAAHARFLGESRDAGHAIAVLEAIKVVESGGADPCDELWIVTCPPGTATERLAARGMGAEEVARRRAIQGDVGAWVDRFHEGSRRIGRPRAIAILDNAGTLDQLHAQVDALILPPSAHDTHYLLQRRKLLDDARPNP